MNVYFTPVLRNMALSLNPLYQNMMLSLRPLFQNKVLSLTHLFQIMVFYLTSLFQLILTIIANEEVKRLFTSNIISILLLIGFLYFVKKISNCLEIIQTHISYGTAISVKDILCSLLTSNDMNKFTAFRKMILEEIKVDVTREIYIDCMEQWGRISLLTIYDEVKDEIKTELKVDMNAALIDQGILLDTNRNEKLVKKLEDDLAETRKYVFEYEVANEKWKTYVVQNMEKIQELVVMNNSISSQLTHISKKVTTLAKFPSIKTIGTSSTDVAVETVHLAITQSPPPHYQTLWQLVIIQESGAYETFQCKPFFEIMYNLKTVKLQYHPMTANIFIEALEIIKSNDLVLDLLHITSHFDRDLSDVLILFTNYKILKFTHTIDFNDLVVHCRNNNITYIRE